jgi:hypothetical protein
VRPRLNLRSLLKNSVGNLTGVCHRRQKRRPASVSTAGISSSELPDLTSYLGPYDPPEAIARYSVLIDSALISVYHTHGLRPHVDFDDGCQCDVPASDCHRGSAGG